MRFMRFYAILCDFSATVEASLVLTNKNGKYMLPFLFVTFFGKKNK